MTAVNSVPLHLEGGEPALELVDGLAGLPQEQRDGGRGHTGLHRQPAYLHRRNAVYDHWRNS